MADIFKFLELRGHTYSDKDGIVTVYTNTGQKPKRSLIFRLLSRARKALLDRDK